jgi:hypothetical protein
MIDRDAKLQAAKVVQRFLDCETDNEDYLSEYLSPPSLGRREKDPVIRAVEELSWNWYDDSSAIRLSGRFESAECFRSAPRLCFRSAKASHRTDEKVSSSNYIFYGILIYGVEGRDPG